VTIIQVFQAQFNRPPDSVEIRVLIDQHVSHYGQKGYPPKIEEERDAALLYDLVSEVYSYTTEQLEFVKLHALDFVKQAALKKAVLDSAKLIGTPNESHMLELVQKALLVGQNVNNFGLDYFGTARMRALKRYSTPREQNQIPFFIPKLDEAIGGVGYRRDGSGLPELLMFGSGPNVGKSRAIGHLVKIGAMLGLNGLVFSAEQSADLYAERLDMSIGLLDTPGLYSPDNFDYLCRRIEMVKKQGATVFIRKYPSRTATILQTLAVAKAMQNVLGCSPQFVAWDYTTEFTAEGNFERIESKFSEIVSAQKRASDELECAGIGAFQINREGMRAEMAELSQAAETLAVARVADIVIMMGQNEEEYKKEPPEMRWSIKKSRSAERELQVLLVDDRKRMFFSQHPDDGMEQESVEEK
jgi:hypothetical protein